MRNHIPICLFVSVLLGLTACGSDTDSAKPANLPPTLSATADQKMEVDSKLTLSISVSDADSDVRALTLRASSSNPDLIDTDHLRFGGSGSSRTLQITPLTSQTGSAIITIIVADDAGASTSDSFVLTVAAIAKAFGPTVTFTDGPDSKTTDPFAVFEFSSTTAKRFECAIDGGEFFACSSPLQLPYLNNLNLYEALGLGNHSVMVRGIDASDLVGASVSRNWTITSIAVPDSPEFASQRLIDGEVLPTRAGNGGWKGIFRINCEFDHAAYDDPIVFPGMPGMAHLHMFYGAKNVDAHTTFDTLNRSAEAGCSGGTLNRSSYWMPALLAPSYSKAGVRLLDASGHPAWKVIKAKVGEGDRDAAAAHEVFYYSAAVHDLDSIESPPIGLRIIAGDNTVTPNGTPQNTSIARWHCLSWGASDAEGGPFSTTIPECVVNRDNPDMLRFDLFFPSCWNGVDLDSPNHKDHMAYPVVVAGKFVCPDSHPRAVARISYHYSFPIFPSDVDPDTQTTKDFRLASDNYTVSGSNGGLSLHGDWFNGWHPEAMDMLVTGCIKAGRDCHDGNFALTSTTGAWAGSISLGPLLDAKGTEDIPDIINQGLGSGHTH